MMVPKVVEAQVSRPFPPERGKSMSREEGAERLSELMRDVFDVDDLEYRDSLKADDVEGWDSLSHVRFLIAVEKEFGFRFTSGEIDGFKNVGEVLDVIVRRATR
jgi:acyl carrier protein